MNNSPNPFDEVDLPRLTPSAEISAKIRRDCTEDLKPARTLDSGLRWGLTVLMLAVSAALLLFMGLAQDRNLGGDATIHALVG